VNPPLMLWENKKNRIDTSILYTTHCDDYITNQKLITILCISAFVHFITLLFILRRLRLKNSLDMI
jgi:hypothetical protein